MDDETDDFEIEVTNLAAGAPTRHWLTERPARETAAGDDDLLPRPASPTQRRIRAAIVSAVVLLAVVMVIVVNPAAKSSLYTVFRLPTPAPSPTPQPGANIVYLTRGAPWGHVTMDGREQPFANLGMMSAWLKLAPGRHTIVITQSPFPTLRCTVSMPATSGDTCPLISPLNTDTGQPGSGPDMQGAPEGSRFIDLGARFDRLPRDAQDALVAAVNSYLNPPVTPLTLTPGDHYLRDDGTMAVAQTPLRANVIPTLLTPDLIPSDSQSCISFCDMSGVGISNGGTWDLTISLLGSWHITTLTGQVMVEHAPMYPSDPMYQEFAPALQLVMSALWTDTWQVSQNNEFGYSFPVCQAADVMMTAYLNANPQSGSTSEGATAARTPEQGCVISLTLGDPNQSDPNYLLYRFGVLLAANDAAHHAFPALPVASAVERAQTRQILANPSYP